MIIKKNPYTFFTYSGAQKRTSLIEVAISIIPLIIILILLLSTIKTCLGSSEPKQISQSGFTIDKFDSWLIDNGFPSFSYDKNSLLKDKNELRFWENPLINMRIFFSDNAGVSSWITHHFFYIAHLNNKYSKSPEKHSAYVISTFALFFADLYSDNLKGKDKRRKTSLEILRTGHGAYNKIYHNQIRKNAENFYLASESQKEIFNYSVSLAIVGKIISKRYYRRDVLSAFINAYKEINKNTTVHELASLLEKKLRSIGIPKNYISDLYAEYGLVYKEMPS